MIVKERSIKEAGGKLVSIRVVVNKDGVIREFSITGDFFAFPPEVIDELCSSVVGLNVLKEDVVRVIEETLTRVVLVGVSKESLLELINSVINEIRESCVRS